ncbi:MAG TPA: flavin reductase family protein [Bradyrhizobium sp.]|nr:flavin reductase family protein [Bradyrhizobium sp.]
MEIDAASLDADAAYRLLVGAVVPRPIAWITTLSPSGLVNAAPFSCYTFVCNDPPMLAINIGRRDGQLKDTARNIRDGGEFVVNVVSEDLLESMHATSAECGPEISEVEALQIAVAPSTAVRPPRIAASPVNLECRLDRILELGRLRNDLVFGRIVHFHVADAVCERGRIESQKLKPVARLAGRKYARLGDIVSLLPSDLALPPLSGASGGTDVNT